MAKRRVRFVSPVLYGGVSYAQNQVVDLDDKAVDGLGDLVEAADDVDVDRESDRLMSEAPDLDARREADIKSEPGDAQDVPDALRDEQANNEATKRAKALGAAPTNKMVENAPKKK